jgi:hypothetical protein
MGNMLNDTTTQLPIFFTAPGIETFEIYCANNSLLQYSPSINKPTTDAATFSPMSSAQRRKLQLHERCNHVDWAQLNAWIRAGLLPCNPDLANTPDPLCAAFQFGKAHKRSHHADTGHIAKNAKSPGDGVSSDGMEAGVPGRIMTTHGSPTTRRYRYCSFWVDHFSQYVYVTMHETKKVEELIRSKCEVETFASKYGVTIKHIWADNGVYAAQLFQEHCNQNRQPLTFCAVGAHWQNGIAERFIGSITQQARMILLHAMTRWPQIITEDLWPYAVRHAVFFHNASICKDKQLSPHELFTEESPTWKLNDFKVFGCSCYVLQKRLQDGDNFSKWKSRSWRGVYMGHSSCHAGNVPLVYNPDSTHVTPQYHIVFDEGFTSVHNNPYDNTNVNLQRLHDNVTWIHSENTQEDNNSIYYFDSFWMDPPIQRPKPKRAHNLLLHEPEGESFKQVRFKMPYCGSPNARENMST